VFTDFEPALQDAFALAFDNISIKGCWFHYVQCIVRRIRHDDLIQRYENDNAFRVWVKQFTALAMIHTGRLEEAFEIILNTCPDLNDTSIQKFISYFINEWLVRQVSPGFWNHYQRQRRTNNDLEGYHSHLNYAFPKHHPNLAKLVKFIQQNHGVSKDIYYKTMAGNYEVKKQTKKEKEKDLNFELIHQEFSSGQTTLKEYFKKLTYQIMYPYGYERFI
jgi:hypothetical protein